LTALTVNGDPHPFSEGLTIADIIDQKKYSFPLKTVFVNGTRIPKEEWPTHVLRAGDVVDVLHMMSGG